MPDCWRDGLVDYYGSCLDIAVSHRLDYQGKAGRLSQKGMSVDSVFSCPLCSYSS